ncbi:MAG: hypothetical protein ABIF92_02160 [archaeon]
MSDTFLDISFEVKNLKKSETELRKIVKAVQDAGFSYDSEYGYSVEPGMNKKNTSLDEAIKEISKKQGVLPFKSEDMDFSLLIFPARNTKLPFWTVSLSPSGYSFDPMRDPKKEKQCIKLAEQFIGLSKVLWKTIEPRPVYGYGYGSQYYYDPDVPSYGELSKLNVNAVLKKTDWLAYFGPELVEKIGEEKLLSAPSYKTEKLDNGVLVLFSPLPFFFLKPKKDYSTEFRRYFNLK